MTIWEKLGKTISSYEHFVTLFRHVFNHALKEQEGKPHFRQVGPQKSGKIHARTLGLWQLKVGGISQR